jgi:UDP-glucuronate 4-epimerase
MEKAIGRPAIKIFKPMQAGDVLATYADTQALNDWVGFAPATPLDVGLGRFIDWVRDYHHY